MRTWVDHGEFTVTGEFLRLLYILAHRRTVKYFADVGDDEPGTDAFTWRRSQYFLSLPHVALTSRTPQWGPSPSGSDLVPCRLT